MAFYTVRKMEIHELQDIYGRMSRDFADGEYPPYNILYEQLDKGIQEGFIMSRDSLDIAYSICAYDAELRYVLISFLAVYEGFRGEGIGTKFLENLKEMFSDSKGIIIEVERPENAKTLEDKEVCEKRLKFYNKSGFSIVPDIDYSIWDIPMHLMVFPLSAANREAIGSAMHNIYLGLFGKRFIHKMRFSVKSQ